MLEVDDKWTELERGNVQQPKEGQNLVGTKRQYGRTNGERGKRVMGLSIWMPKWGDGEESFRCIVERQ